ncbi:hypothetical protein ACFX16_037413 [Malus domestica]
MGSEQHRFPQQELRKRWGGCWGAFSCFASQKGGKRIVPATRIPEGNASAKSAKWTPNSWADQPNDVTGSFSSSSAIFSSVIYKFGPSFNSAVS